MISPPSINKGEIVRIVSTARKISLEAVDEAASIIKEWGFEVQYGENLLKEYHQFAGTDDERLEDIQSALDDPTCRAIFCARGGYGTVRLIDRIDYSKFIEIPKWVIGYSDVTALHCHINETLGIETLHASMPVNFPKNTKSSLENLRKVLMGEALEYTFKKHKLNRPGHSMGIVVGGNLSMLYSLTGSMSLPLAMGKILFIEDLDEYLYHIDRMMMGLKRAGLFNGLNGVVIGGMTDMNDNEIPFGKTAEEIIADVLSEYEFPVAFNFPAGHLDDNNPIILGRRASLDVDAEQSVLSFNF